LRCGFLDQGRSLRCIIVILEAEYCGISATDHLGHQKAYANAGIAYRFGERIAQSLPIVALDKQHRNGRRAEPGAVSSGCQFSSRNRVNLDRPFVSVGKTIDHNELQIGTAFRERLECLGYSTRVVIKLLFPKEDLLYGDCHSPSLSTFSVCGTARPAIQSRAVRRRRIPVARPIFVVTSILIAADKTSRKSAESAVRAFSAATSYVKSAAHARISIISRRIANVEGRYGRTS
jgi:hypothetical protein